MAMTPRLVTATRVVHEYDRIYIVDQRGERWEITQAASDGFWPESFRYGLGRHAFEPLSNNDLGSDPPRRQRSRVIGVSDGRHAQAYLIDKLAYHEVANTHLGQHPIAVGY